MLLNPCKLLVIIGFEISAVAVIVKGKQADAVAKLCNIGKVLLVYRNGILKAEFIIKVKKLLSLGSSWCVSAVFIKAEGLVIIIFEIVICGDNKNSFAAFS